MLVISKVKKFSTKIYKHNLISLSRQQLSMELETEWLSKQSLSGDAKELSGLMRQVMQDINSRRMCTLTGIAWLNQ